MSTSETRLVLVGIVVVALIGLAALARWYRNRRLNARDDEQADLLRVWPADLADAGVATGPAAIAVGAHAERTDWLSDVPQTLLADEDGAGEPREDQLDDEWADTLAAMNAEHLNLIDHLERVHPAEPCQEWCCWERRLEAQRAAWLELVRADVTVVAEWIVAGTPGRWVPSAAGWPSDDWRGEMIPA